MQQEGERVKKTVHEIDKKILIKYGGGGEMFSNFKTSLSQTILK